MTPIQGPQWVSFVTAQCLDVVSPRLLFLTSLARRDSSVVWLGRPHGGLYASLLGASGSHIFAAQGEIVVERCFW